MNSIQTFDETIFEHVRKTDDKFSTHFHNTYTIGITHDGVFKSLHEKKTFYMYKNSTKIINPHEVHGGDSNAWQYTNFYPSIKLLSEVYEQIFFEKKTPLFTKHIVDDPILYKLLLDFFIKSYQKEDALSIEASLIEALSYLIKNFAHTTKEYEETFDSKAIIKNSIEYIKDSLDTNITLDDLASNSKLSKYHFLRTFKNSIGLTPHQFLLIQRIEKAKELISKGISLSEIAFQTGFSDQSHFNRSFKKMYGYSPSSLNKNKFEYQI